MLFQTENGDQCRKSSTEEPETLNFLLMNFIKGRFKEQERATPL